jgi:hypothetical protein
MTKQSICIFATFAIQSKTECYHQLLNIVFQWMYVTFVRLAINLEKTSLLALKTMIKRLPYIL